MRQPSASPGLSQTAAASVSAAQSSALSGRSASRVSGEAPGCLPDRPVPVARTAALRVRPVAMGHPRRPAQPLPRDTLWTAVCARANSVPGRCRQDLRSLTARCRDKLWPPAPRGWRSHRRVGRDTWLLPGPGQRDLPSPMGAGQALPGVPGLTVPGGPGAEGFRPATGLGGWRPGPDGDGGGLPGGGAACGFDCGWEGRSFWWRPRRRQGFPLPSEVGGHRLGASLLLHPMPACLHPCLSVSPGEVPGGVPGGRPPSSGPWLGRRGVDGALCGFWPASLM